MNMKLPPSPLFSVFLSFPFFLHLFFPRPLFFFFFLQKEAKETESIHRMYVRAFLFCFLSPFSFFFFLFTLRVYESSSFSRAACFFFLRLYVVGRKEGRRERGEERKESSIYGAFLDMYGWEG